MTGERTKEIIPFPMTLVQNKSQSDPRFELRALIPFLAMMLCYLCLKMKSVVGMISINAFSV